MSLTPLKINTLGSLLQNQGFYINPTAVNYMGSSTGNSNYTPGVVVTSTNLVTLVNAINLAYPLIGVVGGITQNVYNELISIGSTTIPALGNSPPTTYTISYTGEQTRYGFLRLFPLQAYNEFHINNGSYKDFCNTFNTCNGRRSFLNQIIKPIAKSQTFLDGIYSNMNDLITSDITGVNLSTFYWGQDLIATGRAIDLKNISKFGSPVVLLRTLYKNNAMTAPLNKLIFNAGFTSNDITNFMSGKEPTLAQEKSLYHIYRSISGTDLTDICTIINCQISTLDTLADLLDVKKLFPNSYKSLTFPVYNSKALPTNSKTYFLIFSPNGTSVNIIPNNGIGARLFGILPMDVAYSCDAFSVAMMQIKNIQNMNIEKFSQVVTNLENVNGLNVNGTNVPVNSVLASYALNTFAGGSGPNGTYTMCDYFGSMTNIHYNWATLLKEITELQSTTLTGIYNNIYSLLNGPGPYTTLESLIYDANAEILSIKTANTAKATQLNTLYNTFGTKLTIEKNARSAALPSISSLSSADTDVYIFVEGLSNYGIETEPEGPCAVLTDITNTSTIGGNSLIASMREARNAKRLGLTGGTLDNVIDTSPLVLPMKTGSTTNSSPISGFNNCSTLGKIPIVTGAAIVPGSLAGSPETTLIPTNLSVLVEPNCKSVLMPKQAVEDVVLCNCDCWDNL